MANDDKDSLERIKDALMMRLLDGLNGLTVLSVILGFLLLCLGAEIFFSGVRYHALLMFCGVGLILGAVGASTAKAENQGILITGSAAIAIGLSYVFLPKSERFVMGTVHSSEENFKEARFIPQPTIWSRSSFFMWERDIKSEYFILLVTIDNSTHSLKCVPSSLIRANLGDGSVMIDWAVFAQQPRDRGDIDPLRSTEIVLFDRKTQNEITSVSDERCLRRRVQATQSSLGGFQILIGAAHAQTSSGVAMARSPLQGYLDGLVANDSARRFSARQSLAAAMSGDLSREIIPIIRAAEQNRSESNLLLLDGLMRAFNDVFVDTRRALQVFGESYKDNSNLEIIIRLFDLPQQAIQNEIVRFVANFSLLNPETAAVAVRGLLKNAESKLPGALDDPRAADSLINSLIVIRSIVCRPNGNEILTASNKRTIENMRGKVGQVTTGVIERILRCIQ